MSLPAPYYDDGNGIVIYCGDSLDLMPKLGDVGAVIADPPYSINTKSDGSGKSGGDKRASKPSSGS